VGGQRNALTSLPQGRDPIPILQEVGWAPGPVWTGAENLTPTGIRSFYRPVCSESLYRLRYPGLFSSNIVIILYLFNEFIIPLNFHTRADSHVIPCLSFQIQHCVYDVVPQLKFMTRSSANECQ
jgi:hypothetical protein